MFTEPVVRGPTARPRRWWWAALTISVAILPGGSAFSQPTGRDRSASVAAVDRCPEPLARIVSAEGAVFIESMSGAPVAIASVGTNAETVLCPGESLRVGRLSRAAAVLTGTGQLLRLDQNTTLIVLPLETPNHPILSLPTGVLRLFSPAGRPLDVRTPFVTAGVEGTEFVVVSDPTRRAGSIGVIEGRVTAINSAGRLAVGPGEVVAAVAGGPPQRINVRPDDQVRWSIFYPPVLWSLPPGASPSGRVVDEAWRLYRAGDRAGALRTVEGIGAGANLDAASLARLAALLLSVGRVDEAEQILQRAARIDPGLATVEALRSVIAIARNDTPGALRTAESAVSRAPNDSAAHVALSYALQASLRLDEARADLRAASADALVLARLAEIELALGNVSAAREAAEAALKAEPSLSRPHTILGFAALARADLGRADAEFRSAIAAETGDPLPRIGLGLAAIRRGDLNEGRQELEIAVALDPDNAVARSYLGKSYAAERRYSDADREWRLAEKSDPRDPTAYLYAAVAERSLNRPVEALRDFDKSIDLNGNRAVYRSRLLLDQDLSVRSTGLATLYRDLGFEQLALSEGFKSVNTDPANPGAHRFLSDTYLSLPRHETASDSELLQSLLLQPLNVTPLRPRLSREGFGILSPFGPGRLGQDEFSPLFLSDGVSLLTDGFAGSHNTVGGNLVASGLYRNLSASAGQFYYRTSGIRDNNSFRRRDSDVLAQSALTERASLLGEFRYSDLDAGDPTLRFDPTNFDPGARQRSQSRQYRLGGRVDLTPAVTIVGVWTGENLHQFQQTGGGPTVRSVADGDFGETAAYLSGSQVNLVVGGGVFSGSTRSIAELDGLELPTIDTPERHRNVWAYGTAHPFTGGLLGGLRLTAGASYDSYRSDIIHRNQLNPKLGVSWDVTPQTTIRAAYFRELKRTTVGGQTIEPTQVAGFNQLYDDPAASDTRRWGIGVDHKLSADVFIGAEWSWRRLDVPMTFSTPQGLETVESSWRETFGRTYASWLVTDRLVGTVEAQWENITRPPVMGAVFEFAKVQLLQLPIELRWFHPSGLFGLARTTLVHEHGQFPTVSGDVMTGNAVFATVDLGLGWRWPGRDAIAALQVRNLFDSRFKFQDTDATNPRIIPSRQVLGRITVAF